MLNILYAINYYLKNNGKKQNLIIKREATDMENIKKSNFPHFK